MGFEGRRFGEARVINVVRGPPWVVDPMRTDLEDIMGVVEVIQNQKTFFGGLASKLFMTLEVPGVVSGEIEAAQAVPGVTSVTNRLIVRAKGL